MLAIYNWLNIQTELAPWNKKKLKRITIPQVFKKALDCRYVEHMDHEYEVNPHSNCSKYDIGPIRILGMLHSHNNRSLKQRQFWGNRLPA